MADTTSSGKFNIPLTQRAYTLTLTGDDTAGWCDALWKTHEAVNKGAQRFGDWLLTLRGGISHDLANKLPKKLAKADEETRRATVRDRRILLALSWLSVESKDHAPQQYAVEDPVAELRSILEKREVEEYEIHTWILDCQDSLRASRREDAMWVNRSAAFDEARKQLGATLTRDEVWDMLGSFFGEPDAYLAANDGSSSANKDQDEKAKDLVQKAGQWLSSRFGTGPGADFAAMSQSYLALAQASADLNPDMSGEQFIKALATKLGLELKKDSVSALLKTISGPGYKSATRNWLKELSRRAMLNLADLIKFRESCAMDAEECAGKTGNKGHRPYADYILADVERSCGIRYHGPKKARHSEFAVILDHAARRVSVAHSWIKRAEERRREFEQDRKKIEDLNVTNPDAVAFLDELCQRRSDDSGAADAYRIRKRAIDGWEEVLRTWNTLDPSLAEDTGDAISPAEKARIDRVRELQDQIEKFGDAQLFEALADSNAVCVWKPKGKATASILQDYVFGRLAEYNKTRFKVPSYRHPDPLLHPVFCDFGNSRWSIEYAVHRKAKKLRGEQRSLEKKREDAERLRQRLAKADGATYSAVEKNLIELERAISETQAEVAWLSSPSGLRMDLWNGTGVRRFELHWHCKRLRQDLGHPDAPSTVAAPRADRFGRRVATADSDVRVSPLTLFDEKEWSGRLQAPREQLEKIAKLQRHDALTDERRQRLVEEARANIGWLVSFSPRLKPQGPGIDYADSHGFKLRKKPAGYELIAPLWKENTKRGYLARFDLCRLPGLRVLSADLGHRYAAACAVWQVLSAEEFANECEVARRKSGVDVTVREMYATIAGPEQKRKSSEKAEPEGRDTFRPTTLYRRIAADTLADGAPHPAVWARLERQFVVKLQGENEPARMASEDERNRVKEFHHRIGLDYVEHTRDVSKLMSMAVRAARLGLRRHSDLARIAFAMSDNRKQRPGGGFVRLSPEDYKRELTQALQRWFNLTTAESWHSESLRDHWHEIIARGLPLPALEMIPREQRKSLAIRDSVLATAAEALSGDAVLRGEIAERFARQWQTAEPQRKTDIRWLRRWVLPSEHNPAIRHVGGLSLDRIANVQELYRLQKAHYQRLTPQGSHLIASEKFFQRAQKNIERMRENRIKQLASRIVEAALGLGSETKIKCEDGSHFPRDLRRAGSASDPRFLPCHAVVMENLERYRPEQSRPRRENRALMSWSAGQAAKYLSDGCSLYGLMLRQVSPNYTSRQDSRSALPGIRCVDVAVHDLLHNPFWTRSLAKARRRCEEVKGTVRDRFLVELIGANWDQQEKVWTDQYGRRWRLRESAARRESKWEPLFELPDKNMRAPHAVRFPQIGGEIFVPALEDFSTVNVSGIQADMNAACNIGLRALMDPDWQGRWWFVPCQNGKPVNVNGSAAFDGVSKIVAAKQTDTVTNLWRNPRVSPLCENSWLNTQDYWQQAEQKVLERLRVQFWRKSRVTAASDDVF